MSSTLFQNHVDPTSTEAGVLAGQVVALTLSVGSDRCNADFGASLYELRHLVVCDATSACNASSRFAGRTGRIGPKELL